MGVTSDWEGRRFIVEADGTYSSDQVMDLIESAAVSHGHRGPIDLLVDLSRSDSIKVRPTEDVVSSAYRAAEWRGHIRRAAIVAGDSQATFGITRMGETYATLRGLEVHVFRLRDDAAAWLSAAHHEDAR